MKTYKVWIRVAVEQYDEEADEWEDVWSDEDSDGIEFDTEEEAIEYAENLP